MKLRNYTTREGILYESIALGRIRYNKPDGTSVGGPYYITCDEYDILKDREIDVDYPGMDVDWVEDEEYLCSLVGRPYVTECNVPLDYKYPLKYLDNTYDVIVYRKCYESNNSLYVGILYFDPEYDTYLPFTDVTVNLNEDYYDCGYVDVNNNPWLMEWLVDNKIAIPTGLFKVSGYCTYPLYRFNISMTTTQSELEVN